MADSDSERRQGLSGRRELGADAGLLFIFDRPGYHSFWMRGMNFPLDFIWLIGNRVVGVTTAVPVTRMDIRPPLPVDKVLEVNSGWVDRQGVKIGDKVSYESVSD